MSLLAWIENWKQLVPEVEQVIKDVEKHEASINNLVTVVSPSIAARLEVIEKAVGIVPPV